MKNTTATLRQMKGTDKKISMITAYDYTMAKIVDESGVNTILVGDSLGNTILGYEDTISVTVDDMIHHSAAVARGAKNALVITLTRIATSIIGRMPLLMCSIPASLSTTIYG